MDELTDYLEALKGLAQEMASLKMNRSARLHYHTLADAVYWSDEIPRRLSAEEDDAIRILLRYRTSVLLRNPEEKWKVFWDTGIQYFPTWIGFSEARVTPSPALIEFYHRSTVKIKRCLDRLENELGL